MDPKHYLRSLEARTELANLEARLNAKCDSLRGDLEAETKQRADGDSATLKVLAGVAPEDCSNDLSLAMSAVHQLYLELDVEKSQRSKVEAAVCWSQKEFEVVHKAQAHAATTMENLNDQMKALSRKIDTVMVRRVSDSDSKQQIQGLVNSAVAKVSERLNSLSYNLSMETAERRASQAEMHRRIEELSLDVLARAQSEIRIRQMFSEQERTVDQSLKELQQRLWMQEEDLGIVRRGLGTSSSFGGDSFLEKLDSQIFPSIKSPRDGVDELGNLEQKLKLLRMPRKYDQMSSIDDTTAAVGMKNMEGEKESADYTDRSELLHWFLTPRQDSSQIKDSNEISSLKPGKKPDISFEEARWQAYAQEDSLRN